MLFAGVTSEAVPDLIESSRNSRPIRVLNPYELDEDGHGGAAVLVVAEPTNALIAALERVTDLLERVRIDGKLATDDDFNRIEQKILGNQAVGRPAAFSDLWSAIED